MEIRFCPNIPAWPQRISIWHERIVLSQDRPEHSTRPSISSLFCSVVDTFGGRAVGGLLTGMGRDGALELHLLKDKGTVTIAQDKDRSVVPEMLEETIQLGGATDVLPPEKIAPTLVHCLQPRIAAWEESSITDEVRERLVLPCEELRQVGKRIGES